MRLRRGGGAVAKEMLMGGERGPLQEHERRVALHSGSAHGDGDGDGDSDGVGTTVRSWGCIPKTVLNPNPAFLSVHFIWTSIQALLTKSCLMCIL